MPLPAVSLLACGISFVFELLDFFIVVLFDKLFAFSLFVKSRLDHFEFILQLGDLLVSAFNVIFQ